MGEYAGDLRDHGGGDGAALDEGAECDGRMDHGGVLDAAVFDADAEAAGYFEGEDRWPIAGDSTADRAGDAERGGFGEDRAADDLRPAYGMTAAR